MSIVNAIRKTIRYGKKNGFGPAFFAAIERVKQTKELAYQYVGINEAEELAQRSYSFQKNYKFSILVPAYETKPEFLRALVNSVLAQTYTEWELILADASSSNIVKNTIEEFKDDRIRYYKLLQNGGISENTNQAIQYATGEYCALLDHDDLLTQDALYEMAFAIEKEEQKGNSPVFLYSDEDKCNADATDFYDPHFKYDFNYDLLLTNNYICHFLVVRTRDLKKTWFRKEYDGAQDYDLVLRLVAEEQKYSASMDAWQTHIIHISKVLYHWRCHMNSTAENPESKMYAYEAGKKALQDYYHSLDIDAVVQHGMHFGFYRTEYGTAEELLSKREDIGVIGGLLVHGGHVTGGAMTTDGTIMYEGIHQYFAGYMNRMHLTQDVEAVDIRCMKIAKKWEKTYLEIVGIAYESTLPESVTVSRYGVITGKMKKKNAFSGMSEEEIRKRSIQFSKVVRESGDTIFLDPIYHKVIR